MISGAPVADRIDPIRSLRADLTAAGYTVDALEALWGEGAADALARGARAPARQALEAVGAGDRMRRAATLARLFLLADAVAVEAAAEALPALGVAGAVGLGLARIHGDLLLARVDLRPYAFSDGRGPGHWWVASDLGELALGRSLPPGHVLGVGGATMTLASLMIPAPGGSVLDLGTGCGILALHASRWAGRVVATDLSPRALDYARFNARLNGVEGIEFRQGNLFDPVGPERFDRIVSNPPFVITPRHADVPSYDYRDGGLVGDDLIHAVVAGAAARLRPGGIAQLLGNWEYASGSDGLERAAGWATEGGPADVWAVERERQSPAEYAETWIRDGGTQPGTAEFDALETAWIADFQRRGVISIGFGYLTVRVPAHGAPALRRLERLTGPTRPSGEHLAAVLTLHDWHVARSDAELAAERLVVASDVTEERHLRPGQDEPSIILLRQGGGFGRARAVDTAVAAFVGACDGELTLEAIAAAIAQLLDADPAQMVAMLIDQARSLLEDAILTPAAPGPWRL